MNHKPKAISTMFPGENAGVPVGQRNNSTMQPDWKRIRELNIKTGKEDVEKDKTVKQKQKSEKQEPVDKKITTQTEIFTCDVCGKKTKTKLGSLSHAQIHKKNEVKEETSSQFGNFQEPKVEVDEKENL